jgi:hypothetical protein
MFKSPKTNQKTFVDSEGIIMLDTSGHVTIVIGWTTTS